MQKRKKSNLISIFLRKLCRNYLKNQIQPHSTFKKTKLEALRTQKLGTLSENNKLPCELTPPQRTNRKYQQKNNW